jgi:hypothetical protein
VAVLVADILVAGQEVVLEVIEILIQFRNIRRWRKFRNRIIILLTGIVYTITVGAGGTGILALRGNNSNDSSISGTGITTITSLGGGGGGNFDPVSSPSRRSWCVRRFRRWCRKC